MNNSFPFSTFDSTTFNILQTFFQIIYIYHFECHLDTCFSCCFQLSFLFSRGWHENDWVVRPTNSGLDFTAPSGKLQVRSLLSSHQPSCHRLLYLAIPTILDEVYIEYLPIVDGIVWTLTVGFIRVAKSMYQAFTKRKRRNVG